MAELIAEEKAVVKFIFPCGGISFLKVSEQEKRRFDADPDFKKKITDAVYNQFLKQKEQSNIQEQLRAEEENRIQDGHAEQEEDSETDNEGPGTSRQQRVRSLGHSRVAVIDGNIRVLPKEAVIKTGGKRKSTLPSLRTPAVKKRLVIDSPASTSTSHVNKLGDVNDGKDRAVVDIDEYGVDDDEDDDERDSDKWTDYQTDRLLDSFVEFKAQFDAPYSTKMKIWIKLSRQETIARMGRSVATLSKKIANMKKTYRLLKRPGAVSKGWKWFQRMEEIFGDDPAVELDHVAEVNDKGPKGKKIVEPKKKQGEKNWRRELLDIEKERVDALKSIAASQKKKNNTFDRLTSAIEKIADK